jgi:hypothetical protein
VTRVTPPARVTITSSPAPAPPALALVASTMT